MKKVFTPIQLEVYSFDEDVLTESKEENEGPLIPL